MKKISSWISNHAILLVTLFFVLMIPSLYGFVKTEINYDILAYLPSDIETIDGQNILSSKFGIGAFAFVLTNETNNQNVSTLEDAIRKLDGVHEVVSIFDVTDQTIPISMLPESILDSIYKNDQTVILVTFRDGISDSITMDAIEDIREITHDSSKVSGMTAMVLDTKNLSISEMSLYIIFAILFCFLVLLFATDSYLIPVFLLGNIGVAILLNMGTNIFLGSISYITQSITAVLQLGVTMDFSIFLYHKYEEAKRQEKDKIRAMSQAIQETFKSVIGSSLTTIAGFLALCGMELTLGMDIGLVMAKGVVCGLLCVLTLFPALLLLFDKQIEKTKHKNLLPEFSSIQSFIIRHYKAIIVVFLLLFVPAFIGNANVEVYYKIDKSLPDDLPSKLANNVLADDFGIISPQIILLHNNIEVTKMKELTDKLQDLDGISEVLTASSLESLGIPLEILPESILKILQNDTYQLMLVNSTYEVASNELNRQIDEINHLVKEYDMDAIVAGEGALTKDLVEIADHDFRVVNYISIGIIFILMLIVLKSISLPFILIVVIELAIFLNMACAYYTNTTLPFIASIVVGTIQLGATIDYAILMSSTYLDERSITKNKVDAMKKTLKHTIPSIVVSACCFFAATMGVSLISKIDMIGSICSLLSRGAVISMVVVSFLLPSLLLLFDSLVIHTTYKKKEGLK